MTQSHQGSYMAFKGRSIDPARKVRIYRNLNNGLISIKQGAHVVGHTDQAFLQNAEFLVSETLRQKVLAEKRKSVHAFVEGMWTDVYQIPKDGTPVWYNPYLTRAFRTVGQNDVCKNASKILVKADGSMTMWND